MRANGIGHERDHQAGRKLPLDGVVVVSCEQAVAAALATRYLAGPAAGDFARGYDTTANGMSRHPVRLDRPKESPARERWSRVGSAAGPLRAVLPDRPPRMDPIPPLGEQTERIMAGLAQQRTAAPQAVRGATS